MEVHSPIDSDFNLNGQEVSAVDDEEELQRTGAIAIERRNSESQRSRYILCDKSVIEG